MTKEGSGRAFERVADRVRRLGPLPFDQYLDLVLYDHEVGFYEQGGSAGRREGDFLTSPEVGPLFGAVLGHAFDTWWDDLGRPDPFVVVDAGAGPGTLAVAVAAAEPECATALTYVLAERSASLRARHGDHLPVSAVGIADDGVGPRFLSLSGLPAGPFTGVILANELLDNLPFRMLERARDGWAAVHVGLDRDESTLVEHLVPAPGEASALADRFAPGTSIGGRLPIQARAVAWLRDALTRIDCGRIVVLDYAAHTESLASRGGDWLRTYRRHERGEDPLLSPGECDITTEVATDQLAQVRTPDADSSQADFLRAHGLAALVAEGQRTWVERAHIGDLEALAGRSRVREAEALVDPSGLGAFRVLEWGIGG